MARIVLVHGLGGTAATMAPLAELLAAAGHVCTTITLPGHGTSPDELSATRWADWVAAVPRGEVLLGQSLGGALVLAAAIGRPEVRAVVAVNAPAPDPDALDGLEWRRSRGHEWLDGPPLADGEVGYERLPVAALVEMAGGVLAIDFGAVTVPVLLVTSAHDEVVDPASADVLAARLGGPVTRLVLPGSGHTATFGPDLGLLVAAVDELVASA